MQEKNDMAIASFLGPRGTLPASRGPMPVLITRRLGSMWTAQLLGLSPRILGRTETDAMWRLAAWLLRPPPEIV